MGKSAGGEAPGVSKLQVNLYTGCTLKLLLTSIKKSNLSVRKCQKSNLTAHNEKNFKKSDKSEKYF